jgi:hypothetical protein
MYSISASSTDPLQNVAPLPPDRQLFLWLYADCSASPCTEYGYQSDVIRFQGDLQPVSYEPIAGQGEFWSENRLHVHDLGCPQCVGPWTQPLLLGKLTVATPVAVGDGRGESTSWGRVKTMYR